MEPPKSHRDSLVVVGGRWRPGVGQMEAEEATNESRGLVGGGGRQMEAGEATNESPGLVGGGGGQMEAGCRADGGRGNCPMSRKDLLVVV